MSTAEVIIQVSGSYKLLATILFNTGEGCLKVVYLCHVPLEIKFQCKHRCATLLGASMWLFFVVHNSNVLSQMVPATELLRALAASMGLFFVVHNSNVHNQMAPLAELLQALAALMWLFFVVHIFSVSVKTAFRCKGLTAVYEVTSNDFSLMAQWKPLPCLQFGNLFLHNFDFTNIMQV